MRISYTLIFLSLSAFGQMNPKIEVLKGPRSMEDFEHHYKGCLENSECDQVMGLQLTRWNELIKKLKDPATPEGKKAQFLELFRSKYGIPVEFYTSQKSQQTFKPLLFNSACKNHNPKTGDKILKGMSFMKSLSAEKAVVWRDQTQIELKTGELVIPQPVFVYDGQATVEYNLPLGDQPLFIKNGDLYILREADDLFYFLKVSKNGNWKVESLPMDELSKWEDKRSEVTCPANMKKPDMNIFSIGFCKTVWNEDSKKTVIVKMHQGCVI